MTCLSLNTQPYNEKTRGECCQLNLLCDFGSFSSQTSPTSPAKINNFSLQSASTSSGLFLKMPPQTRLTAFPKVVIARDTDSEDSSSGEELGDYEEDVAEQEESDVEDDNDDDGNGNGKEEETKEKSATKKAPITISLKKVCKVCKRTGHEAGFKGATYIDCPMKPCFLCKMPGHTTMNCPHKVATEFGVVPAVRKNTQNPLEFVFERQLRPRIPKMKPAFLIPDQVSCGVIRYHSRRITCLEFHPTKNNILLSGDKKGQLGVWDFDKVDEKTVYEDIHSCLLNSMKINPMNDGTLYSVSSDGTVGCTDIETGISQSLMNLNPNGWQGPNNWRMLYGLAIHPEKGLTLVADDCGYLYMLDVRSNNIIGDPVLIHKKGSKVVGLHCNPVQPDLLLSCGNDHFARIWDIRRLETGSSLYNLPHKRVVNSAYFSPISGSKIVTTCQDNRIRVWDSIFGSLDSPSREIVHSHDFNRHLTAFRAEWDLKDPSESLVVIGRYISENYDGIALHPIDFIDVSTGQLVAEVMDQNITTISPVNKLHPQYDILASGSARSLFIWKPKAKSEAEIPREERKKIILCGKGEKKSKRKSKDGSDNDSDDGGFNKKSSRGLHMKFNNVQGKSKGASFSYESKSSRKSSRKH